MLTEKVLESFQTKSAASTVSTPKENWVAPLLGWLPEVDCTDGKKRISIDTRMNGYIDPIGEAKFVFDSRRE